MVYLNARPPPLHHSPASPPDGRHASASGGAASGAALLRPRALPCPAPLHHLAPPGRRRGPAEPPPAREARLTSSEKPPQVFVRRSFRRLSLINQNEDQLVTLTSTLTFIAKANHHNQSITCSAWYPLLNGSVVGPSASTRVLSVQCKSLHLSNSGP